MTGAQIADVALPPPASSPATPPRHPQPPVQLRNHVVPPSRQSPQARSQPTPQMVTRRLLDIYAHPFGLEPTADQRTSAHSIRRPAQTAAKPAGRCPLGREESRRLARHGSVRGSQIMFQQRPREVAAISGRRRLRAPTCCPASRLLVARSLHCRDSFCSSGLCTRRWAFSTSHVWRFLSQLSPSSGRCSRVMS